MTDTPGRALEVALAYFRAWTGNDLELALTYIAPDVVCDAPAGRIVGVDAYRAFLGPFVEILLGAELLGAFGDDETATVVYDTRTVPVRSGPGAELVRVRDGRITYSRFIFDRLPFEQARRSAPGAR